MMSRNESLVFEEGIACLASPHWYRELARFEDMQ